MFTQQINPAEKNHMSGANPHVFNTVTLNSVTQPKGIAAFNSFEYSPQTGYNNAVNYWRASEIVGQARERNPDESQLVVVITDNSIQYLEQNSVFSAALITAGKILKDGKIPDPIILDRMGNIDDPEHNIALIADYYPEAHAIVLRGNSMELSSTVNPEDHPRIAKIFHDLESQRNKIVVAAEVRKCPGKQDLDHKTFDNFKYSLTCDEIHREFAFHVDVMLSTFSLSAIQATEIFEASAARAVEFALHPQHSTTPIESLNQSALAFEIAVASLNAVIDPHSISELLTSGFEVGGRVIGLITKAGAIDLAQSVLSTMQRIPKV
jgi:hypothetical protein